MPETSARPRVSFAPSPSARVTHAWSSIACSRVDTLVAATTTGKGTIGRAVSDPSLYANSDSLVTELRALVADVKANPKRYVNVRVF